MDVKEITEFLLSAITQKRGDDLYRAKNAFKNFTADEMKREHGVSGSTRQQILDGYIEHDKKCDEAVIFVNKLAELLELEEDAENVGIDRAEMV